VREFEVPLHFGRNVRGAGPEAVHPPQHVRAPVLRAGSLVEGIGLPEKGRHPLCLLKHGKRVIHPDLKRHVTTNRPNRVQEGLVVLEQLLPQFLVNEKVVCGLHIGWQVGDVCQGGGVKVIVELHPPNEMPCLPDARWVETRYKKKGALTGALGSCS